MRSVLAAIGICAVAAIVTVAVAPADTSGLGPRAEAVKEAALADAQTRLESFVPPPGAQRVDSLPARLGLSEPGERPETPDYLVRSARWTVGEPVGAVRRWLIHHAPPGSRLVETGAGSDEVWEYGFWSPELKGIARERKVLVTVVEAGSHEAALRVDSQSVWVEPRPLGERIPPGVRVLEVERRVGGSPWRSAVITDPAVVGTIVAVVDGLGKAQPSHIIPGLVLHPATVRLWFRRRRGGPALAEARLVTPSYSDTVGLTVRREVQPTLADGERLVARLRGVLDRLRG